MVWITLATLLVIAAYVFYVWVMICVAFSLHSAQGSAIRSNSGWRFAPLLTEEAEDSDYAVLWQTQTRSLQLLRSAGSNGLVISRLQPRFDEFARTYPELADGGDFPGWIECLYRAGVAAPLDHRTFITAKGLFIPETVEQARANLFGSRADHCQKDYEGSNE